jgi:hypothetical protein
MQKHADGGGGEHFCQGGQIVDYLRRDLRRAGLIDKTPEGFPRNQLPLMRYCDGRSRECVLLNARLQNCERPAKALILVGEGIR